MSWDWQGAAPQLLQAGDRCVITVLTSLIGTKKFDWVARLIM